MFNYDKSQFQQWLQNASPDQRTEAAVAALTSVSQLPREHRDSFVQSIKREPSITQLLEQVTTS